MYVCVCVCVCAWMWMRKKRNARVRYKRLGSYCNDICHNVSYVLDAKKKKNT